MKLVIIPSIIWLISVALAVQTPEFLESAKKRSSHIERIETMVCSARLENIKFKCNLEYRKIDIKADLETIKSNTVCKKLMNNLEANCDDSENENCRERKEKLRRSCEIRLADIKVYQSKAINYLSEICDNTLRKANYQCTKDRLVKELNSKSENPKSPRRSKLRNVSKNKEYESQSLIKFIFGDSQYDIPEAELSSYIKEVFGKKRVLGRSAVTEKGDSIEEPEPVNNSNLSEAQINLANEERERLSKLTKNPDFNHVTNPALTTTISGEKYNTGSIVNFVFGDSQHTIPKNDLASFVTEIYKTTSPSSIIPTPVSTDIQSSEIPGFIKYKLESTVSTTTNGNPVLNANVEAIIDYIFERLKHKIGNHVPFSSSDQRWGRNVQPIITYLFGRYKHKVEKHNLLNLLNNKGNEKSVLLNIILDLMKGYKYRSRRLKERKPIHIYLTNGRRNPRFYKISRFNDEKSRIRIPERFNVSYIFQILDEIFDRSRTSRFYSKPTKMKVPNGKSRHYQYSYHHIETKPEQNHINHFHENSDSDVMLIYKIIANLLKLNRSDLISILDTVYYRVKQLQYPQRSKYEVRFILKFLDKLLHRYLNNRHSYRMFPYNGRTGYRINKGKLEKIQGLLEHEEDERERLTNGVDVNFIFKIIDELFKEGPSYGETKPKRGRSPPIKDSFQSDDKEVDREKDKSQSEETESESQIEHFKPNQEVADRDKEHFKPDQEEADRDKEHFKPDQEEADRDKEHFKPHLDRNRYKLQMTEPETEVDGDVEDQVQEGPGKPSQSDDEDETKPTTVKTTTKKIKKVKDKSKFTTKKPKILRGKRTTIAQSTTLPTKQQSEFTVNPKVSESHTVVENAPLMKPEGELSQLNEISTASPLPESSTPLKIQIESSSITPLTGTVTEISVTGSESISESAEAGSSVTNAPNLSTEQLASSMEQSTISSEIPTISSSIETKVSEEQSQFSTEPVNLSSNITTKSSGESTVTTQTPLVSTEASAQTTEEVKITTEKTKKTSEKR